MNNATCETCQRKQGTTNVALDEFYLKNHLGSTVAVMDNGAVSTLKAAYDYRAFGEQVDLEQKGDKVTENFTGKERDDETELNYFGARYLDPMLGLWTSVDAARQYQNPYLYAGNNPIMRTDPDGNADVNTIINGAQEYMYNMFMSLFVKPQLETANKMLWDGNMAVLEAEGQVAKYSLVTASILDPDPVTRRMAAGAVAALDVIEGYCDNGAKGALGVSVLDVSISTIGKMYPGGVLNRFVQNGFSNVFSEDAKHMFDDKIPTPSSSDEIIPETIAPVDKTNVEW